MLPFSIAIMANAGKNYCESTKIVEMLTKHLGTDLALMDLAQQALKRAGLPTILKTGRVIF